MQFFREGEGAMKSDATSDSITVRDQLAMAALTGICAPLFQPNGTSSVNNGYYEHAKVAYGLADAMLKVRDGKY